MPPLGNPLPLPPADSCLLLPAPLSTLATYKPLSYLAKCPAHFCTIDARCIMEAHTKLYHNSKHPKMFQPHFILSGFLSLAGDCQRADPVYPSCRMMYGLCFHFCPQIQLDCEGCRVTWLIQSEFQKVAPWLHNEGKCVAWGRMQIWLHDVGQVLYLLRQDFNMGQP